jgi:hypothetical protein
VEHFNLEKRSNEKNNLLRDVYISSALSGLTQPDFVFKGNVKRKLRWVENGVIRRVWALHRGAGHYFVDLGGLHLVYAIFLFPVSTARIIVEFWKNR